MATNGLIYRCYLLRLWQTSESSTPRVTLLNVHDATDYQHFLTIDDLYLFLHRRQTANPTADPLSGSSVKAE